MALTTAALIKANFETGDRPTAANFVDMIDTSNKFITAEATSATIAVTKDTDYAVPAISQPAGSYLWNVSFIPAGNIVTAGNDGDDLDFEIGTAASGGEIVALSALLDDGGSALTWTANFPVSPILNGEGRDANYLSGTGGAAAGIATSEAVAFAATGYSAAARDLHVNFRAKGADLATAATTIKVYMTFMVA